MAKYRFDKESGQVIEKPERVSDVIEMLPYPTPPAWFVEIYEDYLRQVRGGGPR